MRKFLWLLLLVSPAAIAQHRIFAIVQSAKTNLPLMGVSVFIKDSKLIGTTDKYGEVSFSNESSKL
jgi:hypothetical protein